MGIKRTKLISRMKKPGSIRAESLKFETRQRLGTADIGTIS